VVVKQEDTYDQRGLNPWISFLARAQRTLLEDSTSWFVKTAIVLGSAVPFLVFLLLGMVTASSASTVIAAGVVALCYYVLVIRNKHQGSTHPRAVEKITN